MEASVEQKFARTVQGRLREDEEQMLRIFNEARDSLSADEQAELRREREDWLVASRGRAQHGGA